MFTSPQVHMLNPLSQEQWYLEVGSLGGNRVYMKSRGQSPHDGNAAAAWSLPTTWRCSKWMQTRKRAFTKNLTMLVSWSQTSSTEIKRVGCLSCPVCGILLEQPEQTNRGATQPPPASSYFSELSSHSEASPQVEVSSCREDGVRVGR